MSSERPPTQETTLHLPAVDETAVLPVIPQGSSAFLPGGLLDGFSSVYDEEPLPRRPLSRKTKWAIGGSIYALLFVGAVYLGAQSNDHKEVPNNDNMPLAVPTASQLQNETDLPSSSPYNTPSSQQPSTQAMQTPQTSPSNLPASILPRATTAAPKIPATPKTDNNAPSSSTHEDQCHWPMDSQGDSEVRSTCAGNEPMAAFNGPSRESGEAFSVYPGLFVHDVEAEGQYVKVSIGSGTNTTTGYILAKIIGNPFQ